MIYKDLNKKAKEQRLEKHILEQGTDLKELELIIFHKEELQIIELI